MKKTILLSILLTLGIISSSFCQTFETSIDKSKVKFVESIQDSLLVIIQYEGKIRINEINYRIHVFNELPERIFTSTFTLEQEATFKEALITKQGFLFHFVDKEEKLSYAVHFNKKGKKIKERILNRKGLNHPDKYYPTYFSDSKGNIYCFQNVKNYEYEGFKVSQFNAQLEETWKTYIEEGSSKILEGFKVLPTNDYLYVMYLHKRHEEDEYPHLYLCSINKKNGDVQNTTDFPEGFSNLSGFHWAESSKGMCLTGFGRIYPFIYVYNSDLKLIQQAYYPIEEDSLSEMRVKHFYAYSFKEEADVYYVLERYSSVVDAIAVTSAVMGSVSSVSYGTSIGPMGVTTTSYRPMLGGVGSDVTKMVTNEVYILKFDTSGTLKKVGILDKRNGNPSRNVDYTNMADLTKLSDYRYFHPKRKQLGVTTYDTGNKVHKIFDWNSNQTITHDIPGGRFDDVYLVGTKSILVYDDDKVIKLKVL